MADIVNGTCHAKKAPQEGPPLFQHGNITFQAHHVGWIVTGFFTIVAMVASFWLINKHLQWYTNKREQRYIVRILFMVPIYAVISFASYLFWNHSTPLLLLRDSYESTVLTSFFYLLLTYISPDPAEQKEIFRKEGLSREYDRDARKKGKKPRKWMLPLGFVRWKPADGLYFLQLMKWGVLQYCVVRPLTTLAAIILDYAGMYCEDSWSPGWGHIYITAIVSVSVTIAMYCLVQLYLPVSSYLKPRKPLLKLFSIKAVVFLTFWQATVLSFFTTLGLVKDTQYMTADNINIGLGAILETLEMAIFAFLHIRAFTYKPYRTPPDRTPRWRSLAHAMNFKETLRELWAGTVYMWYHMRGRETDREARREAMLEDVFGKTRWEIEGKGVHAMEQSEKGDKDRRVRKERSGTGGLTVEVGVDEVIHVGEERQWLGLGDKYAYSLGYAARKEKSDGLEEQIEKELEKRGLGYGRREPSGRGPKYDLLHPDDQGVSNQNRRRSQRTSWWRNIYNRISQSEPEPVLLNPSYNQYNAPSKKDRSSYHKPSRVYDYNYDFEDPPPPSAIRTYKAKKASRGNSNKPQDRQRSLLSGLPAPDAGYDPHYIPSTSTPAVAHLSSDPSSRSPPRILYPPSGIPGPSTPGPLQPIQAASFTSLVSSPITDVSHPDSVLARVFPYSSDASHSGEALSHVSSQAPPSSQSHQSRVKLAGDKQAMANGLVVPRNPNISVPLWTTRPAVRSQEAVVAEVSRVDIPSERLVEETDGGRTGRIRTTPPTIPAGPTTAASIPPPKSTRSRHLRDSALYQARVPEAEPSSRYPDGQPQMPSPRSGKYRPDRLVMPSPLANPQPSAYTSRPPASSSLLSPIQLTTSPATYVPSENSPGTRMSSPPFPSPQSSEVTRASHSRSHYRRPADVLTSHPPQPSQSTAPPKLRRSTYNVKRQSYIPEQHRPPSIPRGRQDRRVSAPIDSIPESNRESVNPYLARKPPPNSEPYTYR